MIPRLPIINEPLSVLLTSAHLQGSRLTDASKTGRASERFRAVWRCFNIAVPCNPGLHPLRAVAFPGRLPNQPISLHPADDCDSPLFPRYRRTDKHACIVPQTRAYMGRTRWQLSRDRENTSLVLILEHHNADTAQIFENNRPKPCSRHTGLHTHTTAATQILMRRLQPCFQCTPLHVAFSTGILFAYVPQSSTSSSHAERALAIWRLNCRFMANSTAHRRRRTIKIFLMVTIRVPVRRPP